MLQIQIATIFLVGCPACSHNFKHFFCELTCSPDQSTFANVTEVQKAHDTKAAAVAEVWPCCATLHFICVACLFTRHSCPALLFIACVPSQVDYYVSNRFGKTFYDSCKVCRKVN